MIDNDLMIGKNYHTLSIDRLFKSNEKKGKKRKMISLLKLFGSDSCIKRMTWVADVQCKLKGVCGFEEINPC
ncbi:MULTISPECIES: hypothetical protein [Klebsiella]|uniref:hypothetical protein n=1 Tax=Klebsiella TaxID=570 RepID=UPI000ADC9A90|nr:hypothetical protein [Klebsiella variicola]MCP6169168.1 hypothetical protein [Klebsiella pneumoniae]HCF8474344.1 hypothetical protein [Klebsiella pneumoniae]HCM7892713.1 hypothetical protein [Klebsiella pneumoniae]